METLLDKIKRIHPLAAMAVLGMFTFMVGVVLQVADSPPETLMWLGGGIVAVSGLTAIRSETNER